MARSSDRRVRSPLAIAAAGALAIPSAARAERPVVDLRLEGGTEYDTNVHRLEEDRDPSDGGAAIEAAPAARLGARGRMGWRRGPRERVRLTGQSELKLFATPAGEGESVLVAAADGAWERGLGDRGATVGVGASYYDAIGVGPPAAAYEPRNFRTGAGELQLALAERGGQRVSADLGYRVFRYKASPLYDWDGPALAAGWHATVWRGDPDVDADAASLDLGVSYRLERRGYETTARARACPDGAPPGADCFAPTMLGRADLHHGAALEAVWTGDWVATARYELQLNDSNSHGESLVRHRLELGATLELHRRLHLTAEAAILYNVFLDGLLIAADVQDQSFVSIEEENRNSLTALVGWRLADATLVEARYAIYSNEFATDRLGFRRQTAYLGVVHELR